MKSTWVLDSVRLILILLWSSNPSPLAAQGRITGTVVDVGDAPLSRVGVTIRPFGWIVYSDSVGVFMTPIVPSGKFTLKFQRLGWIAKEIEVNISEEDTLVLLDQIYLAFGDLDDNGEVDLRDVVQFMDILEQGKAAKYPYIDVDASGVIDSLDLERQLLGFGEVGIRGDEWIVSNPDYVGYLPGGELSFDATNQHYLVTKVGDTLFCTFIRAYREADQNQQVVFQMSPNEGFVWSDPVVIDGANGSDTRSACCGFTIFVPKFNRIYVFYNKDDGSRVYLTGDLYMKYSEDFGRTWNGPIKYEFRRGEYSPPEATIPPSWWVFQNPIVVHGKFMVGFTEIMNQPPDVYYSTEIRFLLFENILDEPDAAKLILTTLPTGQTGIRGSFRVGTQRSGLQEPSLVELSNGTLFVVMRSGEGSPLFSVSNDTGKTWSNPQHLRYNAGGERINQPLAPCPLYRLSEGRYLFVFHNNDGTANDGFGPSDLLRNRTPTFVSIAEESLAESQPLKFGQPIQFLENFSRAYGPDGRTEIGTYGSLTEHEGHYVFWYPDRKHFLLGKKLPKPITKLLED